MIKKILQANNIEDLARLIISDWFNNSLDMIGEEEVISLRNHLLEINASQLAKELYPIEKFAYNRILLVTKIASFCKKNTKIHNRLRALIWQRRIKTKLIQFIDKTHNDETKNKLNILLQSIKTLEKETSSIDDRKLSQQFILLSDVCRQLGFMIFSLLNGKSSLRVDPNYDKAILNLGKLYVETGLNSEKNYPKANAVKYNFQKAINTMLIALEYSNLSPKDEIKKFLEEINISLKEISQQHQAGTITVLNLEVKNNLLAKLEDLEKIIIEDISQTSDYIFPGTIEDAESRNKSEQKKEHILQSTEPSKPGKLFRKYKEIQQSTAKDATQKQEVQTNKIGYRVQLEKILKKTIDEKRKANSIDSKNQKNK